MLLFAVALAGIAVEQVTVTPSQRELYRHNSGRCLGERAVNYLNDDDVIGSARLLAKECMSYMPDLPPCPKVSDGFTIEFVAQCEADDKKMIDDIRAVIENTAVRMIEIARRRRGESF